MFLLCYLYRVEDLSEVIFNQRPEWNEGLIHVKLWQKECCRTTSKKSLKWASICDLQETTRKPVWLEQSGQWEMGLKNGGLITQGLVDQREDFGLYWGRWKAIGGLWLACILKGSLYVLYLFKRAISNATEKWSKLSTVNRVFRYCDYFGRLMCRKPQKQSFDFVAGQRLIWVKDPLWSNTVTVGFFISLLILWPVTSSSLHKDL